MSSSPSRTSRSYPKPLHPGTLPIHIGGASRAAARRAGLRGDGYFPGGRLTGAERAAQIDLMRETARAAGRDGTALEYTRFGALDMGQADVGHYSAQGVTRLVMGAPAGPADEQREQISAFAQRVNLR